MPISDKPSSHPDTEGLQFKEARKIQTDKRHLTSMEGHGEKLISYKLVNKQWLQNTSEKRGDLVGEGFLDTSYSGVNIQNRKLLQIVNDLVKRFLYAFTIKKL